MSVENPEFAAFARRIVAAHGRRVAAGDVEGLRDLLALREAVDRAAAEAVYGLRERGYSWGEIAARLGVSKASVHERWSRICHEMSQGAHASPDVTT